MLYLLLRFAMRPFRRWWRRMLIAAVVGVAVVPAARQYLEDAVTDQPDTITIPHQP